VKPAQSESMTKINQEQAKKAWSEWLTALHDPTINRCLTPKRTFMTAKTETKPSKVKDEFLADLIRHFGAERGVELYQEGLVSKDDLAAFDALLVKFDVTVQKKPTMVMRDANFYGFRSKSTFAGTDPS
jgi:RNA:NAD 2'-phosphotransferase (TPT1/KptA family)